MKTLTKIFFKGLLAIMPITLSVYFLIWFFESTEKMLDGMLFSNIEEFQSVPGLGIITGVIFILILGLLLTSNFFRWIFSLVQLPFKNIPLVRSVYSAVEDLMFYFNKDSDQGGKVVLVTLPENGLQIMGLMTREDVTQIQEGLFSDDTVAVYLPMSYAFGGHTIFISKKDIQETDVKVEVFMKSALTAWMKKK